MIHAAVRIVGLVRKEAVELVRQPGLLLAMVLGPLAILLLFGSGVRPVDPIVSAIFVAPPDDPELADVVRSYAQSQDARLTVQGIVGDRDEALTSLWQSAVDVVVIFPRNPVESVERGERATVEVFHSFLDPLEAQAIELFTASAVDDLNDQLLATAIEDAQGTAADALPEVEDAQERVDELNAASGGADPRLAALDSDLDEVSARLEEFVAIDATVLAAPLRGTTEGIIGAPDASQFYAPAVVALILQHLTLTFVALSLSREAEQGTTELFAVSPLRPGERVAGKLIAYLLVGAAIGAALIAAVVLLLNAPIRGGVAPVAVALVLELLASIGLGFVLARVARSTTQVVQGAMLLLLVSVFFGGLLISAARLYPWARPVGWPLPMAHALPLLRESMLRGQGLALVPLAALSVLAAGFTVLGAALVGRAERGRA